MTRVLLVGLQPETVDYSDPALPPGMDAKKIQAGIELGLKKITDRKAPGPITPRSKCISRPPARS
jgi:hypothetical protein